MRNISDIGAFTAGARDAFNESFRDIRADFYVDAQYGFDGNDGKSPGLAFKSMSPLSLELVNFRRNQNLSQPIVVALCGALNQEWSAPIVNDVRIVGAGNMPRQATTSGVANGGGATWLSPTGGTGSLLTINGQAWDVSNIYFNNTATSSATGCIKLVGGGDPPLTADAGHARIRGCKFTGEANGILWSGGPGFVLVEGCDFLNFDSSGDKALASEAGSPGGGTGWAARILNNVFRANLTHISVGSTAYGWEISGNRFSYIDVGVTTTTQISLSTGSNNSVHHNYFDLPHNTNNISAMFVGGTNDRWYWNYFATAVTTTIAAFSVPAT